MTLLTLTLLPVLLAFDTSVPSTLEWKAEAGRTYHFELVTKHYLTTESMVFYKGGKETISQRVFDLRVEQTLRASDRLLEVGEGRPSKFRRYYDQTRLAITSEMSGSGKTTRDRNIQASGGVDGLGVVFTYVPEDDEYGRYYDALEGIEESLPVLGEDLGLRCVLPPTPVSVGDSWKLPVSVLEDVISPGGNLSFDLSEAEDPNVARTVRLGTGGYLCDLFGGEEKGEVEATWTGIEEEEGRHLARIELVFDVTVSRDLAYLANTVRSKQEVRARTRIAEAPVTLELKGKGTVRWDLDRGRLFDTQGLSAEERVSCRLHFDVGTDAAEAQQSQVLVMVGTVTQESRLTEEE